MLTAGGKATVISGRKSLLETALESVLSRLDAAVKSASALDKFGAELSSMVLDDAVLAVLPSVRHLPLIVVHDELRFANPLGSAASRRIGRSPAAVVSAESTWAVICRSPSGSKRGARTARFRFCWSSIRRSISTERSAKASGCSQLLSRTPAARIEVRHGADARKERLAADLRSGLYDVVHYAGHAFFDPAQPARSGILCANEQVLSGADLAGLGNLPSLVFFNACEGGTDSRSPPAGS